MMGEVGTSCKQSSKNHLISSCFGINNTGLVWPGSWWSKLVARLKLSFQRLKETERYRRTSEHQTYLLINHNNTNTRLYRTIKALGLTVNPSPLGEGGDTYTQAGLWVGNVYNLQIIPEFT